jgi:MATE family multidrug resistance protein
MPLLAHALGQCQYSLQKVRRIVRQSLQTAILLCLPAWLVMWNCDRVLLALGQSGELAELSTTMMRSFQWGLLPYLGFTALRSFLAAIERPLWTVLVIVGAVFFNAVIGWILIFGHAGLPALGLRGAGIAGALTNFFMFFSLVLILQFNKALNRYHLLRNFHYPDWKRLRTFWKIGLPVGTIQVIDTSIFYTATNVMGWIGVDTLAAHALVHQITSAFISIPVGLSQAGTIRVGRAFGAGQMNGARFAGWSLYLFCCVVMFIPAILFLFAPEMLVSVFVDTSRPKNAALVAIAVNLLAVGAIFVIVDGLQFAAIAALRGLQDTFVPLMLAIVAYWGIGLPIGVALAFWFDFGGIGIWLGLTTALLVVGCFATLRWVKLVYR